MADAGQLQYRDHMSTRRKHREHFRDDWIDIDVLQNKAKEYQVDR
jgi:hypothetical protein